MVARARERLDKGDTVVAIQLPEAVLTSEPGSVAVRAVMLAAHEALLADPAARGNFWLRGCLTHQIRLWSDG